MHRALVISTALVLSSCQRTAQPCSIPIASYMLVEYRADQAVMDNKPPQIQQTPSYGILRSVTKSVAIKLPDDCRTRAATIEQGTSRKTDGIMATRCGFWLAELERALTEQGYKVIAWSALRQEEDSKGITTVEAARKLEAEVVLVVNSMEQTSYDRGHSWSASYRYFDSDSSGIRLDKAVPADAARTWLKAFVKNAASVGLSSDDVTGVAATLDVTAVLAQTGESIWFFRHTLSRSLQASNGMRFLFTRLQADAKRPCPPNVAQCGPKTPLTPVRPEGLPLASDFAPAATSEDVERGSVSAEPEDKYEAEKHELARLVANECVDRFKSGAP